MPRTRRPLAGTTRASLQIAAFAAIQAIPILAIAPVMPSIAALSPPLYAGVAGVQTLFVFAARLLIPAPWAATLTAALTAVLVGPFTAIGWLIAVPLVLAGAAFDLVTQLVGRWRMPAVLRHVLVGTAVGSVLFAVSLPVMSAEHLTAAMLVATWAVRVATSILGSWLAGRIVAGLIRAGIRPPAPRRSA